MNEATARAHPNIAFIKYWGNIDETLRLPANPSLSMNLDGILTETRVRWDTTLASDTLRINNAPAEPKALERVSQHLDLLRQRLSIDSFAAVDSSNNFPMGAGIASSASAFAALTVAGVAAAGAALSEKELTVLARQGSGSAARSVPSGFVEWFASPNSDASFARSIAPQDHWSLVDVIAVVSKSHKKVGSTQGHGSANTSDLQGARVAGAAERVRQCREAVLNRDFAAFAEIVEHDSNLMHAVMMTSQPPLFYWEPPTLTVMEKVREWRADGVRVCYTLDAGPNIHCLCLEEDSAQVIAGLQGVTGVLDIITAKPGGGAVVVGA
ncbi:MAG: diphosphomevalonate decarboxylase [Anaerolineae bacterium]